MIEVIEMTTFQLNPQDTKRFIEFQKHYGKIVKLIDSGVFDIRNGSSVLHFDRNGSINRIERHDNLFPLTETNPIGILGSN